MQTPRFAELPLSLTVRLSTMTGLQDSSSNRATVLQTRKTPARRTQARRPEVRSSQSRRRRKIHRTGPIVSEPQSDLLPYGDRIIYHNARVALQVKSRRCESVSFGIYPSFITCLSRTAFGIFCFRCSFASHFLLSFSSIPGLTESI